MTMSWVSCECLKLINEVPKYYILLNTSSKIRTVQNFGILCIHAQWANIINILVILVGPNCLGCVIGCDNDWAYYIWGDA